MNLYSRNLKRNVKIGKYGMLLFQHYVPDSNIMQIGEYKSGNMPLFCISRHVKDIVILTSLTHVLTILSNYFWFLLLLVPLRAFWLLWKNVLGPWFFQEAPEDTEQDEKKKKKMERKMKRYQQQHRLNTSAHDVTAAQLPRPLFSKALKIIRLKDQLLSIMSVNFASNDSTAISSYLLKNNYE